MDQYFINKEILQITSSINHINEQNIYQEMHSISTLFPAALSTSAFLLCGAQSTQQKNSVQKLAQIRKNGWNQKRRNQIVAQSRSACVWMSALSPAWVEVTYVLDI